MAKNKKPTMMEVKNVINNMLMEMQRMQSSIYAIDSALASYVEFRKNTDEWNKWVDKKLKERNAKTNQPSAGTNKGTGTAAQTTKGNKIKNSLLFTSANWFK